LQSALDTRKHRRLLVSECVKPTASRRSVRQNENCCNFGPWTLDFRPQTLDCAPAKLASAARLRSETTLPIKWIAARVRIGTAKGAKSVLPHLAQSQDQRKTARALEPCA